MFACVCGRKVRDICAAQPVLIYLFTLFSDFAERRKVRDICAAQHVLIYLFDLFRDFGERGLLQKEVANIAGLHPANYNKTEKGERELSIEAIDKIAKYFGMTIEKINLLEQLEPSEKSAFYTMLDALITKKKLKDNLTNVLQSI